MTNEIDVPGSLLPKTPQVESASATRPICLHPGLLNTACYVLLVEHGGDMLKDMQWQFVYAQGRSATELTRALNPILQRESEFRCPVVCATADIPKVFDHIRHAINIGSIDNI